jgi:antitoxin component YwqK of YwqJK toxin-antitoxin module
MINFAPVKKTLATGLIILLTIALSAQDKSWNREDGQGRKQGSWKATYPSGMLKYEGQFVDGQPVDTFFYFYPDGKLQSLLIHGDSGRASAVHFYQSGGKLAEGDYLNQKKSGTWTTYGANEIKLTQGGFINGLKSGKWYTFYENGQISEELNFERDFEEGEAIYYYPDGTVKEKSHFEHGFKHGLATFYNSRGQQERKGMYYRNVRDGKWLEYDERQKIIDTVLYDKGELVNPEEDEVFLEDDGSEFRSNRKDHLEFEDLKGKIEYE